MVRPHLEYGQSVWSPYLRRQKDALESVQRRATKAISKISKLQYQDRLRYLNLPTLKYRRKRGDHTMVYKILHDEVLKLAVPILKLSTYQHTRGHNFKLYKDNCSSEKRKVYIFSESCGTME